MQKMTSEEQVEFLDVRSVWDQYLRESFKPGDWFHRDIVHANGRGKQVLGASCCGTSSPSEPRAKIPPP